jgi:hypothetical protein
MRLTKSESTAKPSLKYSLKPDALSLLCLHARHALAARSILSADATTGKRV